MAYKLNKTDGTLLVDLIDGTIDVNSTSITLVGRNYTGYGEAFNENFIKLKSQPLQWHHCSGLIIKGIVWPNYRYLPS
mgnify:CR=1 FL=1